MRRAGSLIKTALQGSLFLIASLLLLLGMAELLLRAAMEFKPQLGVYEVDFELGKRLRPGFRGEKHYGVPVSVNSAGMRDREFERKKAPGAIRILALGDSWTNGLGVRVEHTWPKRLEARLRERFEHLEVMNSGVSGYETYNEALYYRRDLTAFEHDLVLVGVYPVNDMHNKKDRYAKHKRMHDLHPLVYSAYMFPRRHLYVSHWFDGWRRQRKHRARAEFYAQHERAGDSEAGTRGFAAREENWPELYREDNRGWQIMRESLRSIGETARASGVGGAVVLFPDLRDLGRYTDTSHPRVAPMIGAAVAEAGLEFIDLVEDFRPYVGRETELGLGGNIGATHPNPDGHDLIARAVMRELLARGLVPSDPAGADQ